MLEHFVINKRIDYGNSQIEAQTTKSSREKVAFKYTVRIPPQQQLEWEAAVREADEALSKKPSERKLAFIKKHSTNSAAPKQGKMRSWSSSDRNEFDESDQHIDSFEVKSKKRQLSNQEERSKLKIIRKNVRFFFFIYFVKKS